MDNIKETVNKTLNKAPGQEGKITKMLEKQTAKIPSGFYLALGVGSIALSLISQLAGKKKAANFIGLWVPTLLVVGLYNKIVKLEGSDRDEHAHLH
jgi:hypothetical protein